LSYFLVEGFGLGFLRYPTNLPMVVYFCDLQELQKAAKGASSSRMSQTTVPLPPKAASLGHALTLEARKASMTTHVPVVELATKEPARA
jgi:hypothetical protein